MFVYLSQEGRYWLKGAMLSVLMALVFATALPAGQALADTPTDRNLASPTGQNITAGDEVSRDVFKPWISKTLPWDGNWGAFNTDISERLGGTCALDKPQQEAWSSFLKKAEESQTKHKTNPKEWKNDLKKYINDQGNSGDVARLLLGGANSDTVQSINGYDQLLNLDATSPQLAACNKSNDVIGKWASGFMPNPLNIFKSPARFIAQMVFFLPAALGYVGFQLLAPFAFGLALSTPHSERGDMLYNAFAVQASSGAISDTPPTAFTPRGKSAAGGEPKVTVSENFGDLAVQKTCDNTGGDADLGFKCENLNPERQTSEWIGIANALRSALSAVYGIIVIAVALLYLFRRNAQSQYHIKTILPRVFLAVILTMAAPYVIGMLITFSNWTVQALFQSFEGSVPNQLMAALASLTVTNYADAALPGGVFAAMAVPTLMLLWIDFILMYLLAVAVGKQLLLIALIVMTPIACLAFVFRDHGKNLFSLWVKGLLAVTGLPIVMATILAGGLMLMRAFWDPENPVLAAEVSFSLVDISKRYISALILAATLFMLMKSVGSVRAWVTGKRAGMAGKMAGTATKLAGGSVAIAGAMSANPYAAAIGAKVGQASAAAGKRMSEGGTSGGSWIPQNSGGTFGRATAGRASGAGLLDKGMKQLESVSRDKQRLDRDKSLKEAVTSLDDDDTSKGSGSGGSGSGSGGGEQTNSNTAAAEAPPIVRKRRGEVVDPEPPAADQSSASTGSSSSSKSSSESVDTTKATPHPNNSARGILNSFGEGYGKLGKPITGPGKHLADKMGSVGSGAGASRASRAARGVARYAATGRLIADPQGKGQKSMNAVGMVLNPAGAGLHFAGKVGGKVGQAGAKAAKRSAEVFSKYK